MDNDVFVVCVSSIAKPELFSKSNLKNVVPPVNFYAGLVVTHLRFKQYINKIK